MNDEMFQLWNTYGKDEVQTLRGKNPKDNFRGTYYDEDGVIYIFATLIKNLPKDMKEMNYQDRFDEITWHKFHWETVRNIREDELKQLKTSKYAHLFIRKVALEKGKTVPFTYVGKGTLTNCKESEHYKQRGTYKFDIEMEEELPKNLQREFKIEVVQQ